MNFAIFTMQYTRTALTGAVKRTATSADDEKKGKKEEDGESGKENYSDEKISNRSSGIRKNLPQAQSFLINLTLGLKVCRGG